MKMWNDLNRPSNLRTTNHCEGWNNSWNAQTRRSSPNNWFAIRFIKIQDKNTKKTGLGSWKGAGDSLWKRRNGVNSMNESTS